MNAIPFADMADDLEFGAPAPARPMEQIAQQRFVAAPAAAPYKQACVKCNGTGIFRSYTGRSLGECFVCKGAGFKEFKTSPEQRARATEQRAARAAAQQAERVQAQQAWAAEPRDVLAWIRREDGRFDFATSISNALAQYGTLTEGQVAAVRRCIERDAQRAAERAAQAAAAPAAPDMHKFWEVLQRHARFYAGKLTISRRNQDQLCWIKHDDAEKVIGKIDNGTLTLWNRPGVDMGAVREQLAEFEGAPLQAAMRWGKLAGRCCSCGRDLTDPASIEAGIGPICAGKFQA